MQLRNHQEPACSHPIPHCAGYIFSPKARQVIANERGLLSPGGCPHCMQGGRAGAQPGAIGVIAASQRRLMLACCQRRFKLACSRLLE